MPAPAIGTVLFDDGQGRFGPLTDLRAVFELRTATRTTLERAGAVAALWCDAAIAELVAERTKLPVNRLPAGDEFHLLNGRWRAAPGGMAPALAPSSAIIESETRHVMAARLSRQDAESFLGSWRLPPGMKVLEWAHRSLISRPWDLLDGPALDGLMADDARELTAAWRAAGTLAAPPKHAIVMGDGGVFIHSSATIAPGVVFDASAGSILISPRATIRPGAILVGPVSIGEESSVLERGFLKPRTVIGPVCRVSGEIGSCIFQAYSNKTHDGHLGDALVGEWVNLGAGTTNSNLLNTYGEAMMRLEADASIERTGRQFMGCVIGDHVKSAIMTRITTGTVIGTGAMVASSRPPPLLVPRFAWLTDDALRSYRCDKFIEVVQAMMARRKMTPSAAYLARLKVLHEQVCNS